MLFAATLSRVALQNKSGFKVVLVWRQNQAGKKMNRTVKNQQKNQQKKSETITNQFKV